MDHLIQSNSAKETTTVRSRGIRHQGESPYSEVPGSFRFPTIAPLITAVYSPDMVTGATRSTHRRTLTPQHADMETDNEAVSPSRNIRAEHSQTSDVTE